MPDAAHQIPIAILPMPPMSPIPLIKTLLITGREPSLKLLIRVRNTQNLCSFPLPLFAPSFLSPLHTPYLETPLDLCRSSDEDHERYSSALRRLAVQHPRYVRQVLFAAPDGAEVPWLPRVFFVFVGGIWHHLDDFDPAVDGPVSPCGFGIAALFF